MSRFLGTVSTRLGAVASGFKYAKVYDAPGCYSLTIPPSATSAKVYVVGAGSSYCAGRYCATSSGCWSGVSFPICDYSFDFCGHLTGAGGGYAEKTYNSGVGSAVLNITVAGSAMTTCAYHTNSSNTVYVRGEVANTISVGSTATSPYVSTTVSNVTYISAATTGNTTVSGTSMTVASNTNINIGSTVTGPGILFNTYITAISGTTLTLSQAASITVTSGNYVFKSGRVYLADNANTTSFGALTLSGVSTSSVSGGLATVSASSGTNLPLSYTCTNATTARNGALDNPTSIGFSLPVCGYQQCYNGWYNTPGTGSGGDINRTGGAGILIPEFAGSSISCFDTNTPPSGTCVGTWYTPNVNCMCGLGYHPTFGGQYSLYFYSACFCYYMCAGSVINCIVSGKNRDFYKFISNQTVTQTDVSPGVTSVSSLDISLQNQPYGLGGSAGSSSEDGKRGSEPSSIYSTNIPICGVGTTSVAGGAISGSSCNYTFQCTSYAYDYSFGGQHTHCTCQNYYAGCASLLGGSVCGLSAATSFCNVPNPSCTNSNGYGMSAAGSFRLPYASAGVSDANKCLAVYYNTEIIKDSKYMAKMISISELKDPNGNNVTDIEYGAGAGGYLAKFGGGGNRIYPAGGSGLVVVLYN